MNITASVVIPVYNRASALMFVLEGLKRQVTNDEFEVVIIDDGSTEDISEVVQKYDALNLTFHRQKNLGRATARNEGVRLSRGAVIIFNDSDRIPCPYFIQEHVSSHMNSANDCIVVGTPRELYYRNFEQHIEPILHTVSNVGHARMTPFTKNILKLYDAESGRTQSKIPWLSTFSGNMSIQKEVFERAVFDPNITKWGFEHIEFGYRQFLRGTSFQWNKNAVNYHLAHSRPEGYYKTHILDSQKYLNEKYGENSDLSLVASFLLGDISLQQYEIDKGNREADWLKAEQKPVMNRII